MWLTHFWHSWSQFFIFAWDVTAGGILRTGVLICLVVVKIWCIFYLGIMLTWSKGSLRNVHDMISILSYPGQNFVAVYMPQIELQWNWFSFKFELQWKNPKWNGSQAFDFAQHGCSIFDNISGSAKIRQLINVLITGMIWLLSDAFLIKYS